MTDTATERSMSGAPDARHTIGIQFATRGDLVIMERYFEASGFDVVSGDASVGLPPGFERADLWVIDEATARRHGDELLAHKVSTSKPLLPILVALAPRADASRWLAAGYDDVVRIPITKAELDARVAVFLRLTERVAEQQELDRARLDWIIRQIPVGVVISEAPSGRILRSNEQMEQILRRPVRHLESIADYGLTRGYHLDGRRYDPDEWPMARTILTGETVSDEEILIERGDGTHGVMIVNSGPVRDRDGRVVAAVATCFDITDRRQLLEAERAARREAEEANRVKDDFLTTVSHELRTPLNAIIGWIQVIKSATLDEAGLARAMETIDRNAQAQAQIVEDLLDISRVVSGGLQIDVKPVDPTAVLHSAVESLMPAAENRGISVRVSADSCQRLVMGDAARLQQVAWNLVANAIKFTPRGGVVEVGLKQTPTHVEITVADNGQGISPEFLPHVFERFRQADGSTTRKHGGLGIGLAIVLEIVAVHGGTVEASSPGLGQGATFTVRIPLTGPTPPDGLHLRGWASEPGIAVHAERGSLAGVRVLILDGDADSRDMLDIVLRTCGAEPTGCASAGEALEVVALKNPDVVVCDPGLPDSEGFAFIRTLRAAQRPSALTPAVALNACAHVDAQGRSLDGLFQIQLGKPVEPAELVTAIASLVGRT